MEQSYDLLVIGAGPGGYVAAIKAAQLGKRVAIAERSLVGGTCLNRGCIPTKSLLHTANLYRTVQEAAVFGVSAEGVSFDPAQMHARKDEVVSQLRAGIESLLKANGVSLLAGSAVIEAAGRVKIGELPIAAEQILIACGSEPARPPIPGLDLPGVLTSDQLLTGQPESFSSIVIIGGGVIGMEFASVYSALGISVTVLESMERILPTLDREISQNLSMLLKKQGVQIVTGAQVQQITIQENALCCQYTAKEQAQTVSAERVLVCTGRIPATQNLLEDGLSLALERGAIPVDSRFETCVKGIYAIGDAIQGGIQLAHMASAQGINAVCGMFGEQPPVNLAAVPSCVYTDPEIACVGITADQAKADGIPVLTGKYLTTAHGKSLIERAPRGFLKLVFDAQTEILLGAQLMCSRASDLIGELTSAVANRLTARQLASVIRPHPTFCEAVTEACEDALGHAIHAMPRKRL